MTHPTPPQPPPDRFPENTAMDSETPPAGITPPAVPGSGVNQAAPQQPTPPQFTLQQPKAYQAQPPQPETYQPAAYQPETYPANRYQPENYQPEASQPENYPPARNPSGPPSPAVAPDRSPTPPLYRHRHGYPSHSPKPAPHLPPQPSRPAQGNAAYAGSTYGDSYADPYAESAYADSNPSDPSYFDENHPDYAYPDPAYSDASYPDPAYPDASYPRSAHPYTPYPNRGSAATTPPPSPPHSTGPQRPPRSAAPRSRHPSPQLVIPLPAFLPHPWPLWAAFALLLGAIVLLLDPGRVFSSSVRKSNQHCQEVIQPQAVISRAQLAQILTIPERDPKQRIQSIIAEPYCIMPSVQIRAGTLALREAYPLEFDPETWLIILYEGDEYAGYRFLYR